MRMSCQYYTQNTTRNFFSIEITKVKKIHIRIQRSVGEVCYQKQVIHSLKVPGELISLYVGGQAEDLLLNILGGREGN